MHRTMTILCQIGEWFLVLGPIYMSLFLTLCEWVKKSEQAQAPHVIWLKLQLGYHWETNVGTLSTQSRSQRRKTHV